MKNIEAKSLPENPHCISRILYLYPRRSMFQPSKLELRSRLFSSSGEFPRTKKKLEGKSRACTLPLTKCISTCCGVLFFWQLVLFFMCERVFFSGEKDGELLLKGPVFRDIFLAFSVNFHILGQRRFPLTEVVKKEEIFVARCTHAIEFELISYHGGK